MHFRDGDETSDFHVPNKQRIDQAGPTVPAVDVALCCSHGPNSQCIDPEALV